jgi:hypothetical protein
MVDVRELEKGNKILIEEEGEYKGQIGIVYECNKCEASLITLKNPAQLFWIGIYNANNMTLYSKN